MDLGWIPQLAGIEDAANALMKEWTCAGVGIAVVKGGEPALLAGWGLRDVKSNLPVTPQTLFSIGSATKAFTTMGLAMLVDEGRLDWDRPVRDALPGFRLWDPFATERITPRDLACHRSGLPRHDMVWYGSALNRDELVSRLQYLEPNKDFRSAWQYSNLMYMAAGYLAGRIGGTSWEELTQERIFSRLGMTNSRASGALCRESPDRAKPYRETDGRHVELPSRAHPNPPAGPSGSIFSSATDMSRWLLLHLNQGGVDGKRLVSEDGMRQMHTPEMFVPDSAPEARPFRFREFGRLAYGLGWFINTYRGHEMIHHGGNTDGFTTNVALLPDEKAGVVVFANQDSSTLPALLTYWVVDRLLGLEPIDWNRRFREIKDERKKKRESAGETEAADRVKGTSPSHPLDGYVGRYEHPAYGAMVVSLENDALKARFHGIDLVLKHHHYDTFQACYEPADFIRMGSFVTDTSGRVSSLGIRLEPAVKNIVFARTADDAMRE